MRKSTVSFGLGLAVCLAWFASSRYSPTASAQGCDAQATPIRCENQLPGNDRTEWDLAGASDATIQGFATTISVNKGVTLVLSIVGYEDKEIKIEKETTGLSINLATKSTGLNDVVVIGYGTQKAKDVTSSISAVNISDTR